MAASASAVDLLLLVRPGRGCLLLVQGLAKAFLDLLFLLPPAARYFATARYWPS